MKNTEKEEPRWLDKIASGNVVGYRPKPFIIEKEDQWGNKVPFLVIEEKQYNQIIDRFKMNEFGLFLLGVFLGGFIVKLLLNH